MVNKSAPGRIQTGSIPPHILVVEDQPNTAEMLSSYFEAQGYEVSSVSWGEDAIAFVDQTSPDLVILDIRLPDIDGYEVCRYLREHQRTRNIPIIFLTERKERSAKLAGLDLGAVDYITKPFDIQELRLRVRNVLRRSFTTQPSDPITGLAVDSLSDEHLRELLDKPDWAVLSIGIRGLKRFSESYGFVAGDDVVRAVARMLSRIVEENRDFDTFVGHLSSTDIFVIIDPKKVHTVAKALRNRLDETMSFFYPYTDRQKDDDHLPKLEVTMGIVKSSEYSPESLNDLKQALIDVQHVPSKG
jgi:PleD family two-component response regulator